MAVILWPLFGVLFKGYISLKTDLAPPLERESTTLFKARAFLLS
jgi:hypothetical protein